VLGADGSGFGLVVGRPDGVGTGVGLVVGGADGVGTGVGLVVGRADAVGTGVGLVAGGLAGAVGTGLGLMLGTGVGGSSDRQRGNLWPLSTAGLVTDSDRLPFGSAENVSEMNSTEPCGMAAGWMKAITLGERADPVAGLGTVTTARWTAAGANNGPAAG
jgi:hypothetical protein